ncbi:BamA/TamA family outer membrane protein [Neosynechococcus sphagnicola]|uniref:BamA/TamA family outer membrane protein n=1 Tax=Neosynechococcus sphagnicola TaxID=1501145 RepID=UPI001EF9D0C1|nr:BamA/TamA family outer membrane protein [Neosynechococcus sphagnicola]
MLIKSNKMRLSPVLVAAVATTATLCAASPTRGQALDARLLETEALVASQVNEPHPSVGEGYPQAAPIPDTVLAQQPASAPPSPAADGPPPEQPAAPGTPSQIQQAPDQFRFNFTPQNTSPNPIQVDLTPPQPAQPTVPSPIQTQPAATDESEPRVLVSEVFVEGVDGTLQDAVYGAIRTQPGRTATRSQLQADVNAIFATGFFATVRVDPSDTPLGVRVTFVVQPNPVLTKVQATGIKVLPPAVVEKIFSPQYGSTLSFRKLQDGIKELNKWYQDNGYVLAQVVGSPKVADDGTVTLEVAEGQIEEIKIRYVSKEGEEVDAKGRPIRGRTRPYVITRELQLKPGDVFNRNTIQTDLQRVFGLGIFEDVKVALNPGKDPRQVVVVLNVAEKNSGSIAAGAGFSSASGLFGTLSYQQQNFRGRNQKIGAELVLGTRELLFDLSFTDPWIKGDPYRTSFTTNIFRRQSISLVFDGDDTTIRLPNGDEPRVQRVGGGFSFSRPLAKNPFVKANWVASLGMIYQHVTIRDADGVLSPRANTGELLSFSNSGVDDLTTIVFGLTRDRRNDPLLPTKGSLLRMGMEQSIPVGSGSILFNRVRASYTYFIPVRFVSFRPGPQSLAFNFQTGGVFGDLPPYEAFALGGSNSVRGYADGELGSGRYFVQGTAEYRFPLFSILSGALFFDAASDLGSGSSVPGDPSGARGLPGSGFGGGLGVRINSPIGPIRVDYGINNEGDGRFSFGIGQRF